MFNTKQVAAVFGVTGETIRVWAEEFDAYLSPLANPGKGRSRSFSYDDMAVFALVSEYKNIGRTYAEIHQSLSHGDRGTPPDIEPHQVQNLITTESEKRLVIQVETLQREITKAYQERDKALQQAQQAQELALQVARQGATIESLEKQLQDAQIRLSDMDQLREQLGELRGELKVLNRRDEK